MDSKNLSLKEALIFGWETTLKNFWFFAGLLLILGLLQLLSFPVPQIVKNYSPKIISSVIIILSLIIQITAQIGVFKISLLFCDHQRATYRELFNYFHLFFKFFWGLVLYFFLAILGTLLLILPGIIWMVQFSFFPYILVEKETSVIDSFKKSSMITRGVKLKLIGINFLLILINSLGVLLAGIGFFFTAPLSIMTYAYIYRKLLSQTEL